MRQISKEKLVVVTPVFNDWEAFICLVKDLSSFSVSSGVQIHIIAVDDHSIDSLPLNSYSKYSSVSVQLVRLATNLGHQRAIAVGLCQAFLLEDIYGVVVMDSDGEDRVLDISRFLDFLSSNSIVVASRKSRTETLRFKVFYKLYKLFFSLLTGLRIDFGNFMYIPRSKLDELVTMPDVWNHLAASVLKSKIPLVRLGVSRGERYCGKSKMNFFNLTLHGLAAISVFIDLIFSRVLIFLLSLVCFFFALMLFVLYLKLFTVFAIPGWATIVIALLALAVMQSSFILLVLTFSLLSSRTSRQFVPLHDSPVFVESFSSLSL